MATFRACESCGVKMPFGKRRTLVDGRKVCDGCNPNKPGEPGRPVGHHGAKEKTMRCEACHQPSENLVRTGGLLRCAGGCRKTADEQEYYVEVDHGDGEHVTEVATNSPEFAEQQAEGFEQGGADDVRISTETSLRTVAHDSGDGETIYHCPFCGSGQVTGRSDGTVECGYCHSYFTVQVQPQFSSMPQTINGQPVDVPGMPGQPGGALPEEGGEEFAPAGSAAQAPEGFAPAGSAAPAADPEGFAPAGSRAASKAPALYVTAGGIALPEESFLAHLALSLADDRDAVLAQVRAERGL